MSDEPITFHAVNKEGVVTAIWEMQGKKHLRTIDPRSSEGKRILSTYTQTEETSDVVVSEAGATASAEAEGAKAAS